MTYVIQGTRKEISLPRMTPILRPSFPKLSRQASARILNVFDSDSQPATLGSRFSISCVLFCDKAFLRDGILVRACDAKSDECLEKAVLQRLIRHELKV
jgi:hypothetical protein